MLLPKALIFYARKILVSATSWKWKCIQAMHTHLIYYEYYFKLKEIVISQLSGEIETKFQRKYLLGLLNLILLMHTWDCPISTWSTTGQSCLTRQLYAVISMFLLTLYVQVCRRCYCGGIKFNKVNENIFHRSMTMSNNTTKTKNNTIPLDLWEVK